MKANCYIGLLPLKLQFLTLYHRGQRVFYYLWEIFASFKSGDDDIQCSTAPDVLSTLYDHDLMAY